MASSRTLLFALALSSLPGHLSYAMDAKNAPVEKLLINTSQDIQHATFGDRHSDEAPTFIMTTQKDLDFGASVSRHCVASYLQGQNSLETSWSARDNSNECKCPTASNELARLSNSRSDVKSCQYTDYSNALSYTQSHLVSYHKLLGTVIKNFPEQRDGYVNINEVLARIATKDVSQAKPVLAYTTANNPSTILVKDLTAHDLIMASCGTVFPKDTIVPLPNGSANDFIPNPTPTIIKHMAFAHDNNNDRARLAVLQQHGDNCSVHLVDITRDVEGNLTTNVKPNAIKHKGSNSDKNVHAVGWTTNGNKLVIVRTPSSLSTTQATHLTVETYDPNTGNRITASAIPTKCNDYACNSPTELSNDYRALITCNSIMSTQSSFVKTNLLYDTIMNGVPHSDTKNSSLLLHQHKAKNAIHGTADSK